MRHIIAILTLCAAAFGQAKFNQIRVITNPAGNSVGQIEFDTFRSDNKAVVLKAPNTATASYTLTLPSSAPATSGDCLKGSTSGVLSFGSCTGSGSTQWVTTGSDIYYTAGLVGIGNSAPAHRLDVTGSAKVYSGSGSTDSVFNLGNADVASPGQGGIFEFKASAATPYLAINALSQGVGWRNVAIANGGGSVCIGCTAPSFKLDVSGTARVTGTATIGSHILTTSPSAADIGDATNFFQTVYAENGDFTAGAVANQYLKTRKLEVLDIAGGNGFWDHRTQGSMAANSSYTIRDNAGSRWLAASRAVGGSPTNTTQVFTAWVPALRATADGDASNDSTLPALGGSAARWSKLWAADIDFNGTFTGTIPWINVGLPTVSANRVFVGPDGSSGSPTFRALGLTDLPSITAAKITSGSATVGQVLTADGSGAATFTTPATSPWVVSGSDIYYTTGLVGIGTSSPAHALHVVGATAKIYSGTNTADTTLNIGNGDVAAPGQGAFLSFVASAGTPYFSINALTQGTGWRNIALANSGGSVCVGCVTPNYKLDVSGTGRFTGALYADAGIQMTGSLNSVTATEINRLSGVTANVQTQIDARLPLTGGTMTGSLLVSGTNSLGTSGADWNRLWVGGVEATSFVRPQIDGGGTSGTSGRRWSSTWTQNFDASGTVKLGTTSTVGQVWTASDTTGNGGWSTPATSPWVVSGSDLYYNTGNVAIGDTTTSIARLLARTSNVNVLAIHNSGTSSSTAGAGIQAAIESTPSSGHRLAFYSFGSFVSGTRYNGASVTAFTTENWTLGSAQGTELRLETTANGAATRTASVVARASGATVAGSLGINTSTPAHALEVIGATAKVYSGTNTADTTLHIGNGDTGAPGQGAFLAFVASAATPYFSINALSQGVAWRDIALANSGGSVCVGCIAPTTKLDVSGTFRATGAATLGSTLGVTGATTLSSTLGVTGATTLSSTLGVTGAATLSGGAAVTGNLSFTGTLNTAISTTELGFLDGVTSSIQTQINARAVLSGGNSFSGNQVNSGTVQVNGGLSVGSNISFTNDVTYNLGSATFRLAGMWYASADQYGAHRVRNGANIEVQSGGSLFLDTGSTLQIEAGASNGLCLKSDSLGNASWGSCGTGVTSIATSSPISGGTITSTGTISCPTCFTTAGGSMSGNISPSASNTYNLGSFSSRWLGFHADSITAYGAIDMRGTVTAPSGATGISATVTVRNAANTGSCTLIYSGGLLVGGTC